MAQSGVIKRIPLKSELHTHLEIINSMKAISNSTKMNNISIARQACYNQQKILADIKEKLSEQIKRLVSAIHVAERTVAIKMRAEIRHKLIAIEVIEKEIAWLDSEVIFLNNMIKNLTYGSVSTTKQTARNFMTICDEI